MIQSPLVSLAALVAIAVTGPFGWRADAADDAAAAGGAQPDVRRSLERALARSM